MNLSIRANRYFKLLCYVLICICLSAGNTHAQPFGIKKYTINDGLPDAYILNIYQDSNGFLWIGTSNGLSRFDGKEFVNYDFADGLPDEYVNNTLEDRQHRLWIGTRKGIVQMKGENFISYPYSDGNVIGYVFDIVETPEGNIWGLTDKGTYQFEDGEWKKLILYPGLENKSCRNLVFTDSGLIVNYGDYLVNIPKKGSAGIIGKDTLNWPYFNVIRKNAGQLYMATRDGMFRRVDNTFQPLFQKELAGQKVMNFFIDSRKRSWISLYSHGLKVSLPSDTGRLSQQITADNELVSQVYEDKLGIIWIASSIGLLRAELRNYLVYDIKGQNVARNIFNIKGRGIMVSSEIDGFLQFSKGNIVKSLPEANQETKTNFNKAIIDGHCTDDQQRLWLATRSGKIFTWKDNRLSLLRYGDMGKYGGFFDISFNPVSKRLFVSSDTLYEGELSGFKKFVGVNTGKYISLPIKVKSFRNGLSFVGTRLEGVMMIDTQHRVWPFSHVLNIPDNSSGVNFYEEEGNRFWVSFSGGIKRYHWNEKQEPVEELLISESNGLPNNSVYSMAFDNSKRMWALTAAGIVTIQFDSTGNTFFIRKWNDADGIAPENLRGGNICIDDNGKIWVQLTDRIYVFNTSEITIERESPRVIISNVRLNLQETTWSKWTDSLLGYLQIPVHPVLPSYMNSLGIFYKGISFRDYEGLEYTYRLNGYNSSWSPNQKSNFVSFVGLPPGKYEFLVMVKDSNTGWSRPASFTFEILKPFWQTWWFIMLMIVLAGYLVFLLFQFRLHEKLVVMNVRQKLHRDLHDDIGATLSSIKVYTEVLRDDPGNSVIIGLIRDNAEEMIGQLELISWATNPQNDSFKSLCELMKKYAVPACYAKKIELTFLSETIHSHLLIPGNVRKNIFLVFKEAVNNIIKYSEASVCSVEIVIRHRKFILHIADDGKGFTEQGKEKGYGIQNMQNRAEELKGTLVLSSSPGEGVTIELAIPYPFKIPNTWDERGREYQ